MIITWNMPADLAEANGIFHRSASGSFLSWRPPKGMSRKNKYTADSCVRESPVFDLHTGGVYPFQTSLPVDRVIFCPTHKYKRKGSKKSTPIPYADILNLSINFVIFEQFLSVFLCRRQKPSPTRGEGQFFIRFY